MIIVYSKKQLSESLKSKISEALENEFDINKEAVQFEIDETILSGIKISINSEVIDLTLNSRLEKIFNLFDK